MPISENEMADASTRPDAQARSTVAGTVTVVRPEVNWPQTVASTRSELTLPNLVTIDYACNHGTELTTLTYKCNRTTTCSGGR